MAEHETEEPRPVTTPRDKPRQAASERDLSRYTMQPEEAKQEFTNAGVPVKLRTIQRYCRRLKLDCIKVDPDSRELTDKGNFVYLIDPASIPSRIEQMVERTEFAGTSSRDKPRQAASERDMLRPDAPGENGQVAALKAEITETRDKLQDAETRAAGHKAVALQMRQDRLLKAGGDPTYPQLSKPAADGESPASEPRDDEV